MPKKPIDSIRELIGSSKVTVKEFTIEAGKVEEFANATHNTNPVHRGVQATEGHDQILAPPTFLMTKQFPRYRPQGQRDIPFDLGFDIKRVLHGEQEFEFERPIYVGDELTGETTLTDVFQRDEMIFAVLETTYTDTTNEVVAIDRTTLIEQPEGNDE